MMLHEKTAIETSQMDHENDCYQNHDVGLVLLYHIDHNFVVLLNRKESKIDELINR
jgi:hypothetical protein